MKKNIIGLFLATTVLATSCKKEGCTDATAHNYNLKATKDDGSCVYSSDSSTQFGTTTLVMEHHWQHESTVFQLNEEFVNTVSGDTVKFSTMKYYVSNIRLKQENGNWWTHPESYFLVDLNNPNSMQLTLNNVPIGNYSDVAYVMGVDSTRNVSGAQGGALSTVNGMFWSWNSGYIMVKAEGEFQNQTSGAFVYHLGGFQGANNIVQPKTASFNGQLLSVSAHSNSKIKMSVDPSKLFTVIGSVVNIPSVHMPGVNAVNVASDFYDSGVAFQSIEN